MKRSGNRLGDWMRGLAVASLMWSALVATELQIPERTDEGAIRLRGVVGTNQLATLERSPDLASWTTAATLHHDGWAFTDWLSAPGTFAFYRVRTRSLVGSDDGRNNLYLPVDPFTNEDPNPFEPAPPLRWAKFLILTNDPGRVWFQNSRVRNFHHDWARLRLPVFQGMGRSQFDQVTLRRTNRVAVLGAILIPPYLTTPEYGIQLLSLDPFTREEIAFWTRRVEAAVQAPPGWKAFFVPTSEHSEVASRERDWLRGQGVDVAEAHRWLSGDAAYSPGWAVGRLTFVPSGQITTAHANGGLKPTDILLTDQVPAEVPFVAGIVTLTPATPNAHVAILARSYGIPFGWPSEQTVRGQLMAWAGREVVLRVEDRLARVELVDATGQLDGDLREALRDAKAMKPLAVVAKERLGMYGTNTALLTPSAVKWVGGKAANYGLLQRVLPTNSQPALALTFDLWDDFMDQVLPGGWTLREEISRRLGDVPYPPPDVGQVLERLAATRELIRRTARFSPLQMAAVVNILEQGGVPLGRKLRFRSSTNVEDTEQFTGAGLYDSYSGCLEDDLDGDSVGPSACDTSEPEERGIFRAIQRVYASFYNDNAFLERRRLGVDESRVGMAVLVHESFPDTDELANGVTTLNWNSGFGGQPSSDWRMVTQVGAESVSNPDSNAQPESVDGYRFGTSYSVAMRSGSSRVPLGGSVLGWDSEYLVFGRLFNRVADGYGAMTGRRSFALDFEFKKSASRGWQVKQVRALPTPVGGTGPAPFLFDRPVDLCVNQGEFGNVFAMHRLKSIVRVSVRAGRLVATNLNRTLLREATLTLERSGTTQAWSNGPVGWPGATFRRTADGTEDSFVEGTGSAQRRWTLQTVVPLSVGSDANLVLFTDDLTYRLRVDHAEPQPMLDWNGIGTTREDEVMLVRCPTVGPDSLLQQRSLPLGSAVRAVIRFYWPAPPRGVVAGYTAPCIGWVGTTLTGLTTQPLELRTDSAQTYHPFHHNFSEEFLLEPAADPGVSAAQREELFQRNIRLIHILTDGQSQEVHVLGWDGKLRSGF